MTNREKTINELRKLWVAATLRKEELIKEIWKQETVLKTIGDKLCKYGEQDFQGVADETAELD